MGGYPELAANPERDIRLWHFALARDLGVAVNTAKAWLSVLEATHQVVVVRPYFANVGKRLVKTPKTCFADPGTLCHLVGLKDAEHAEAGPMAAGAEVDFLVGAGTALIPVGVKKTAGAPPGHGVVAESD